MFKKLLEYLRCWKYTRKLYNNLSKLRLWARYFLRIQKRKYYEAQTKRYSKSSLPVTIQLPITYKCNFDCVMCGMRNLTARQDFSAKDLRTILNDRLFSEVRAIGINGGEPFLKKDLIACVTSIVETLPNLKNIYIISNGFFTNEIVEQLHEIKKICQEYQIKINVSFSVDGVDDMQDFMRGHKDAFVHVNETLDAIERNQAELCDSIGIVSTITRHNIYRISEVEEWAKNRDISIFYNIATIHKRIDNFEKEKDFSVFSDKEAIFLSREFFYKKYYETKNERYFALYLYLYDKVRYSECEFLSCMGVTLTPDRQLSYCATHCKELGDTTSESAYNLYRENHSYLKELKNEFCGSCSHYIYSLSSEGLCYLRDEEIRRISF